MTQTLDSPTTLDTIHTMRAAVVTEFGAPLEICDVELPTPGYGEALVKLEASGVPHRPARGARRLAGEAAATVRPRPRGLRYGHRTR